MVDISLCVIAGIALLIYLINGSKKNKGKMPPGPYPIPFIGNLNVLDMNRLHKSLMELSNKYGEVFTIHIGSKKVVIIAGYKAVKDALITQADDFGERADTPIFRLFSHERGLVFSRGEEWKSLRRFTLSTLRDFGMGKKSTETKIHDELVHLIKLFKSHNGKPFDTRIILNTAVCNIICSIIFGKRFEYNDASLEKLINLMAESTHLAGSFKLLFYNYYPLIGAFLGFHKKVVKNVQKLVDFGKQRISNHRRDFDENDITGYVDAYILKQKQESKKEETYFSDENMIYSILDLFSAGSETTSTTIAWGILLMAKYPEIQKRVQEEIRTHVKPGQLPMVDDRKNMPYTDAVIHEIQRFSNIVPLNVSHAAANDAYFRGYYIPKGTEVIPLLTSVLFDKSQWKTPYEFNPNHFLDANGKFVRPEAFIPFSTGRRVCVGESLAKMEIFLIFTGLLQSFTFHPPNGVSREDLSLEPEVGFLLLPAPYLICAKPNN